MPRAAPGLGSDHTKLKDTTRENACVAVLAALKNTSPEFAAALRQHFQRLPQRYAADVESAEDVATHMQLLDAVRAAPGRATVAVRAVHFTPAPLLPLEEPRLGASAGAETTPAPPPPPHGSTTKRPPTFGSSLNLLALDDASSPRASLLADASSPKASGGASAEPPRRALIAHELAVAARNRPRLLSALSTMLGELGLNINEAHVFCADDGLALDVFVVDGWHTEEADDLHDAVAAKLATLEEPTPPGASPAASPPPGVQAQGASASAAAAAAPLPPRADGSDWEIDTSKLQFLEKVASGSFGDLFRGMYNGQEVAIKVLRLAHHNDQAHLIREFMQELAVLRKVRHKHIVQLIGASTSPPKLCIVTEFMRRGSLLDYLHRHHPLRQAVQIKLALDVARGMDYLHRCNIIHRDLKAANLLMNEHDDCKVADFGVARVVDSAAVMTAETGTYRWMAPEVVSHQRYDGKCDVFSFGVLLWEIVTGGAVPYAGFTPLQAAVGVVQKGLRPTVPEGTHPGLARLMARCWDPNPAVRPDFGAIIAALEALPVERASGSAGGDAGGTDKSDGNKSAGGFFARMRRHL